MNALKAQITHLLQVHRLADTRTGRTQVSREIWRLKKIIRRDRNQRANAELLNLKDDQGRPAPLFRKVSKRTGPMLNQLSAESKVPGSAVVIPPASGSLEIASAVASFFRTLYSDDAKAEPSWYLEALQNDMKNRTLYADKLFTYQRVTIVIDKLKGKTSSGGDGVLTEMLLACPANVHALLASLYRDHFVGRHDAPGWENLLVVLIPKLSCPRSVNDFRPVAVLSVLFKVYFKCIAFEFADAINFRLPQYVFGYRKHLQTLDEIHVLRQTIEKCNEWDMGCCFMKTDVLKADDLVHTRTIIEALNFFDFPPVIIDSIIRE